MDDLLKDVLMAAVRNCTVVRANHRHNGILGMKYDDKRKELIKFFSFFYERYHIQKG